MRCCLSLPSILRFRTVGYPWYGADDAEWAVLGNGGRSLRDGREKEARRELGKRVWPAKRGQERVRIIGDGDSMCTEYKTPAHPRALEHGPSASESSPLKLEGCESCHWYLALATVGASAEHGPRIEAAATCISGFLLAVSPHAVAAGRKWDYHGAAGPGSRASYVYDGREPSLHVAGLITAENYLQVGSPPSEVNSYAQGQARFPPSR